MSIKIQDVMFHMENFSSVGHLTNSVVLSFSIEFFGFDTLRASVYLRGRFHIWGALQQQAEYL